MENQKIKKIILKIPLSVPMYMFSRRLMATPRFIADLIKFKKNSNKEKRFSIRLIDLQPCLTDRTSKTPFEPHYIYHPAWAARIVAETKPAFHVDIASTLHFCTVVSAFVPVKFYDYRPAELNLGGLHSDQADLTDLHFESNSIKSLSCLHTIEHVGLGRYGDPLDPQGDIKACKELSRVLAVGGNFLFVTPIGKPKIVFNAHRIYSYEQVLSLFPSLKLKEFSMVPDDFKKYGLIRNADPKSVANQDCACGCFWFTK